MTPVHQRVVETRAPARRWGDSLRMATCLLLLWAGPLSGAEGDGIEFFEKRVRPVLVEHCHECHSGQAKKIKAGLRLDSRAALLKGGDSGPAIVPGDPDQSLLLRAVRHADKDLAMPPKKPALPAAVIADLTTWVRLGAPFPAGSNASTAERHWAFQPVQKPPVPAVIDIAWPRTPVDRFLLAREETSGTRPTPAAPKRVLLRRATYDLTGLPPTPGELAVFERDTSPDAFAKVVERLLASPAYGERWGRHWLDVVRYADTAGENTDHPLPHAWRYRNWVIQAFNTDLPYDEFIREQIAGDILAARGPAREYASRIVATGYLAIARRFGHDIDKDMHLTFEDTIDTLGKSVLGLTLGCARCHNHKYDPVTARDYYGLYGIFQSTRLAYPGCEPQPKPRDLVPLLPPAEVEKLMAPYRAGLAGLDADVKKLATELAQKTNEFAAPVLATLGAGDLPRDGRQDFVAGQPGTTNEPLLVRRGQMLQLTILPKANHGADSTGIELEITEQGGSNRVWNVTRDVVEDFHERGAGAQHSDRFGNPAIWHFFDLVPAPALFTRFERDAAKTAGLQAWHGAAETPSAFVNVATNAIRFYTVTMPPRTFGLHPGPKGPVALAWQSPLDGAVTVRGRVFKFDPGGDGVAWRLELRPGFGAALADQRALVVALEAARKRRDDFAANPPPVPVAYAAVEGQPGNARVQKRGEPSDPGEEAPRKFPDILGGQTVPAGSTNSGRLELAGWLVDPANPLTARVMVNRLWQHHFGRGLVKTPNDFGTRGEPPTHPALLDYLAGQFIQSGWSVKAMHRLIMLSASYQVQTVAGSATGDSYAAYPRRRLDAEEIRDTLLGASGELDPAPGAAHPFPPESTWGFTQHGPFAASYDTAKRGVYVMLKRNRREPFFALFDGADPNASTPVRDRTTVPTQALFFMNDPFVHGRAAKFSGRIVAAGRDDLQRLEQACQLLFSRPATAEDAEAFEDFRRDSLAELSNEPSARQSLALWSAYARVLFAANEFIHVD